MLSQIMTKISGGVTFLGGVLIVFGLLSYFGEMNDREIGDALGTGRANVQYHRSRALAMMRKTLEQESEEY